MGSSWCANPVLCGTTTLLPQYLIQSLSPRYLRNPGMWTFAGIRNCQVTMGRWVGWKVSKAGTAEVPVYVHEWSLVPSVFLPPSPFFFFYFIFSLFVFLQRTSKEERTCLKKRKRKKHFFSNLGENFVFSRLLKFFPIIALYWNSLQFSTYLPIISFS